MDILVFAIVVAAFEVLLLWGKISIAKKIRRRLDNSLAALVPATTPWWARWYEKLWFALHFPVAVALIPMAILYASIGRNGQLTVPNEYFCGLNLVILTGLFAWLA